MIYVRTVDGRNHKVCVKNKKIAIEILKKCKVDLKGAKFITEDQYEGN